MNALVAYSYNLALWGLLSRLDSSESNRSSDHLLIERFSSALLMVLLNPTRTA